MDGLKDVNDTIEQAIPGKGFWEDPILPLNAWSDSNAQTLTSGTTPTRTVSGNEQVLTWAAGVVAAVKTSFQIPPHLAKGSISAAGVQGATLKLFVAALTGGTTDAITLTATVYARSPAGAQKGPFVATKLLTSGGANPQEAILDLSCVSGANFTKIEPGDTLNIAIAPSAHGTDNLVVSKIAVGFRRNASNTNKADTRRQ